MYKKELIINEKRMTEKINNNHIFGKNLESSIYEKCVYMCWKKSKKKNSYILCLFNRYFFQSINKIRGGKCVHIYNWEICSIYK